MDIYNPEMKSKAICIVGMHRSGTSVIARAINLLGAYLGEEADLVRTLPDNPEGYWERCDINNIHDRILHQFKKTWDTILPFPEKWHLSNEIKPFRDELAGLIKKHFLDHKLWVWKDPRTSILLPIWKDVLNEFRVDLACLMIIRNPLDVAKSLEKRDRFLRDKSFGIWFNYNITALKAIYDVPCMFISYDKYLNDWRSELKRYAAGLGILWPEDDSELKEKMNNFIRPDLRHSISSLDDLKKSDAPGPIIELYGLLEEVIKVDSVPDALFFAKAEKISREFSSYAQFFQGDKAELFELRHNLVEKDHQLAEKDHQLQLIFNSRSWKITAPLRWLRTKVKLISFVLISPIAVFVLVFWIILLLAMVVPFGKEKH